MRGSLTAIEVRTKPPGRWSDGQGLFLLVKPPGKTGGPSRRYWLLRVMVDRRRREFGIGPADTISGPDGLSLATARTKAALLRAAVKAGADPVAEKREAVTARRLALGTAGERTFKAVAERFIEGHATTLKSPKQAGIWRSTLAAYAYPTLGQRPIDSITGPMVLDALDGLWTRAPETARRVRQRIAAVLDFGHARGWRGPKPDLAALTAKALPKHSEGVEHHAAVAYPDAPGVLALLHAESETIGRLALLWTIYTAARGGETRGATWGEVDLAAKLWTVPGERMKMGRQHVVPLSGPALAVLTAVGKARVTGKPDEFIFPGTGGRRLSDATMAKAMRITVEGVTVHGWRSTFRDWAGETTGFPADVCEAALAHQVGTATTRAYARGTLLDRRRELMDAWASFLAGAPANVTRLPTRAAS